MRPPVLLDYQHACNQSQRVYDGAYEESDIGHASACLLAAADDYVLGPDSKRQPGVPQGKVSSFTWKTSKIFPGTTRITLFMFLHNTTDRNPRAS